MSTARFIISRTLTIPSNTTVQFLGRVNNNLVTKFYPLSLETLSETVEVSLFENPTITTIGTLIVPEKINRRSLLQNTTIPYESPTVSNNGQLIFRGVANSQKKAGGHLEYNAIFTLARNTDYLYTIHNTGNSSTTVYVNMVWEEVF